MERKLGLTGTSVGMTEYQEVTFRRVVRVRNYVNFRHGVCVGADAQGHKIMREEKPGVPIIGHPPINKKSIAEEILDDFDGMWSDKEYLERDRDIVVQATELVATPRGYVEERRSGTWYTVRYAVSVLKPVTIIWPNGSIKRI